MANPLIPAALIGAGAFVAYQLLRPRPVSPAPPAGGVKGFKAEPTTAEPCFAEGPHKLDVAELARIREAVDNALMQRQHDAPISHQAVAAASAAMRDLCPGTPVPAQPYQIAAYEESNGHAWAKAYRAAWMYASGQLIKPVT